MIPKIIHHIAPANQEFWHPLWDRCWPTWQQHFPRYEHRLWNDADGIDDLVRLNFPEYWPVYQAFPFHIMRIDFAKLCILYEHGGVYTDMDIFCYENFEDLLDQPVCLLECFGKKNYRINDDSVQELENSIIACEPKNKFIMRCLDRSVEKFQQAKKTIWNKEHLRFAVIGDGQDNLNARMIEEIVGSYMVKEIYDESDKSSIGILKSSQFTNIQNYEPGHDYKTLHLYTAFWGQEAIKFLEDLNIIDRNLPLRDKLKDFFYFGHSDRKAMEDLLERMLDKDV